VVKPGARNVGLPAPDAAQLLILPRNEEGVLEASRRRSLIRGFLIEILVYAVLVIAYFVLVLRFLADPLYGLFNSNLVVYAFVALGLIVAQGVVLEAITSFILHRLGLDKIE
jgi:hypothetical protein